MAKIVDRVVAAGRRGGHGWRLDEQWRSERRESRSDRSVKNVMFIRRRKTGKRGPSPSLPFLDELEALIVIADSLDTISLKGSPDF